MCGITGLCLSDSGSSAAAEVAESCLLLQHRGQDGCGIGSHDVDGHGVVVKGLGLVARVFGDDITGFLNLTGSIAVGHVRYRTSGKRSEAEVQPLHANDGRHHLLLCHNGHLVNQDELTEDLGTRPHGITAGDGDSTFMLQIVAAHLRSNNTMLPVPAMALLWALKEVYRSCRGAFACLLSVSGSMLVGFRDSNGLKPLVFGRRCNCDGSVDYMFASESVALDRLGFTDTRDVLPGEAVVVVRAPNGQLTVARHQVADRRSYTPDIFEYVYFARPDSCLDGISVHHVRRCLGRSLGQHMLRNWKGIDDLDVVIPVPESSNITALATAQTLGLPFSFGLVKNCYVGRTFIMPGKPQRQQGVRRKLSAIVSEFKDKHVLLVDDSIVRGTTSKAVIQMAYAAGAAKVSFASYSPAIRYNHVHGIDLANEKDLIAHERSEDQVLEELGCDGLIYLPLQDLVQTCSAAATTPGISGFEVGLFSGSYVTDEPVHSKTRVTAATMKRHDSGLAIGVAEVNGILAGSIVTTV